jgi:hypothetical protein
MTKLLWLIVFFPCGVFAQSSFFPAYDSAAIREKVMTPQSAFYWPSLKTRYFAADTTFGPMEFYYLAYGTLLQSSFESKRLDSLLQSIKNKNFSGNYAEASDACDSLLNAYPACLTAYFEKTWALKNLMRNAESAQLFDERYIPWLRLYSSATGNGHSKEEAIIVLSIQEAYEVLRGKGWSQSAAALEEGSYLILPLKKNADKLKVVYFRLPYR